MRGIIEEEEESMGNPDSSSSPPPQTPPQQAPPPQQTPPPQSWQSQPQQPAPPPAGGGISSAALPGPVAGTTIADFVTRAVAFIIDGVILAVVNYIVWAIVFALLPLGIDILVHAIAVAAISAAYFIFFWTTRKQTAGMMAMKLMVVQDGTGEALTQQQAIRRWMYLGLPYAIATLLSVGGLGFGAFGLGGLVILFTLASVAGLVALGWEIYLAYTTYQDARKQGVHDKAVNSVVISVGPSPIGGMRT